MNKRPSFGVTGVQPKNGFVPDEETAIKIAEAVLLNNEGPFSAMLTTDEVWVVSGSVPRGAVGGAAYVEIFKKDGRILRVAHGK